MSSSSSNIDIIDTIPFEDIELATNNFADENLLTQTSYLKLYKGRLVQSSGELVDIVVRTWKHTITSYYEYQTQKSITHNELDMLEALRHKNIVPIFKIYGANDGGILHPVIINKHEANGSLDKHLSSSTLGWIQRLHICIGIARALSYLHYDAYENHKVIHGNIKSSKILLDQVWEPKLHGFGFAVKVKRNELHLTDKYNGSILYMDPAYETARDLTTKSDVFSFGVVLFEVLFGIEASVVTLDHKDNWYFVRMARANYEEKTLDEKIDPDLLKQMNMESLKIFSETAYFCLKERRLERPDMKKVFQRLEKALKLQPADDQSPVRPSICQTLVFTFFVLLSTYLSIYYNGPIY
uniref:receptor-like protein kinase FERONIA n=1 Tax=Erigeron canadensis TaxID=72917 RepID=UPI001CB94C94|nr:receptor-like protein kinase FERONIA [Erigeron canadensis]